jgi:hypothetical protein
MDEPPERGTRLLLLCLLLVLAMVEVASPVLEAWGEPPEAYLAGRQRAGVLAPDLAILPGPADLVPDSHVAGEPLAGWSPLLDLPHPPASFAAEAPSPTSACGAERARAPPMREGVTRV